MRPPRGDPKIQQKQNDRASLQLLGKACVLRTGVPGKGVDPGAVLKVRIPRAQLSLLRWG